MSATATNSKPAREQLTDQLDRLDAMIDTLGDGLNAAVADACREGARAAVREVLLELIANPDLLAAVRSTVPAPLPSDEPSPVLPPPAKSPAAPAKSLWGRIKTTARKASQAVTGAARTLLKTVAGAVKPATDALRLTGTTRAVVAVALGVGLTGGGEPAVPDVARRPAGRGHRGRRRRRGAGGRGGERPAGPAAAGVTRDAGGVNQVRPVDRGYLRGSARVDRRTTTAPRAGSP